MSFRSEILRVRKQQRPAIADPVVEFDFAIGGFSLEIRGQRANWKSHVTTSCHSDLKSFGCENNSAQLLPIQSWNLILPSVVSASKSGASVPIGRAMLRPHVIPI